MIPTLKARQAGPSTLGSLSDVAEMKGISLSSRDLLIGGATCYVDVAADDSYPALSELASHIGDPEVLNRGTIGGSIANNDPSACYPAAALASGATIVTNTREIAAAANFPFPEKANYQKFVQPASRFALVGVFVAKTASGVCVAVTGASNEGVHRWTAAEDALLANFSASSLDGLTESADNLISDLHGSPEYCAHLVKVMTSRSVTAAS